MPTPFPGMDPYLEQRGLWEQVHTRLIVAMADWLGPIVQPDYWVSVEERAYLNVALTGENGDPLIGKPDVLVVDRRPIPSSQSATPAAAQVNLLEVELPVPEDVTERFLEVREAGSGDVITVIELLSPANKVAGTGRREYEQKRMRVLASATNLLEIDLVRRGTPLPMRTRNGLAGDYRIVVSRARQRPKGEALVFGVRDPIPDFPVPLRHGEPEPQVPLNRLLHELYDRAGYDLVIDYRQPPDPPLSEADATWASALSTRTQ